MKINRAGILGDIYTDPETNVSYKLACIYVDSCGNSEYTWSKIGTVSENETEKIPEGKIPENVSENEKPVEPVREQRPKYTNYNHYKK